MLAIPASLLTLILINGSFALVALTLGFVAGWWIFSKRGNSQDDVQHIRLCNERSLMAAGQIQDLTARVVQDVGAHSSKVERLSVELNEMSLESVPSNTQAVSIAIAKILGANQTLQGQLANAEQKLEEQAREIENHQTAARTDSLTGLNNRRAFDDEMKRRFSEWQRMNKVFSLALLDIDHFKKFNDTHGHQAGDEVLRYVGKALGHSTRSMDIACRYGGEEFAIILPNTATNDAKRAVERIRKTVETMTVAFEGKLLKVTISAGLAEIMPPDTPALLVRRADDSLYASKNAGRNCGHFHDGMQCIPITPGQKAFKPAEKISLPEIKVLDDVTDQKTFEAEVNRRVAESHRYHVTLSIMIVVVRDYATILEKYGQLAADFLLDTVAQFLIPTIRKMDMISRRADDRFAIMLPGSTLEEASLIERRIESSLSKCSIPIGQEKIPCAVSIGLAEIEPHQATEELIEAAEQKALIDEEAIATV
ncbi:MAG: diguanylate cyclase [Pirellulales bacterium]|nr:diguanylate cyclase [Pirellulales bacterium]